MGFDVHALNFLTYCSKARPFRRVVTVGRQSVDISDWRHVHAAPARRPDCGEFAENLLQSHFGAEVVESYDCSPYEGATRIGDFNHPLYPTDTFDTVVDGGTLEHIYDVTQALQNMVDLCALGGQIIHIAAGNNFCGHGFWQFSPELFFSLYSESNGFERTEVFISDLSDETRWFQVTPPHSGERAEIMSNTPFYLLCRTFLAERRAIRVQQSDYVHNWSSPHVGPVSSPVAGKIRSVVKKTPLRRPAAATLSMVRRYTSKSLSSRNPHLTAKSVRELLRK